MTTDHTRRRVWGLLGAAGATAVLALGSAPTLSASAAAVHKGTGHTTHRTHKHNVAASETDNGRTITLRRGNHVTLTLHSTYWSIKGSSNPAVLHELFPPATRPMPAHCVPGQGCGTVSASFAAVSSGRADVTASRTTCGEALQCAPAQRDYVLHVVVTG
jgi:hypothetical protein